MTSRATRTSIRFMLVFVAAFAGPAWAEYTDTIILNNGNEITGNVKGLAQGQLSVDTDAMGTVSIEWDKVTELLSATPMQIETTGGVRYFGQLERPPGDTGVSIKSEESVKTIAIDDVVHITPIAGSFWGRIQGSLSAGFSFTKTSDVAQFSLSGDAIYRTRRNQFALRYTNIVTGQDSGTTEQLDTQLNYRRLLERRWFGTGFVSLQRNQELGIDGRTLVGAGAGRTFFEDRRGALSLSSGLDLNVENTTSGSDTSGELFGALDYALYKYKGNQRNLSISLIAFPGLTEWGRFRWQFNTRWRQQLFNNFFLGLTLYGTGDNEPPAGALASSDYGIVTTLGWSFGP